MQVIVELTKINCGVCGGTYAINERYREEKEEDGASWSCPYCRTWWGYGEGKNARLKRELENARNNASYYKGRLQDEERSHSATKGHLTRVKTRVAHGVCPCCNRTFRQLARHMKAKHPEYTP